MTLAMNITPPLSPAGGSMLQVFALGNALITLSGCHIRPSSVRSFATLLYLASEPGRRFPRAGLLEMIFPDLSERNGAHALRQLIYKLRQSGAPIETAAVHVWIDADQVWTDYGALIASPRLTTEQLKSVEGGFLPGYIVDQSKALVRWFENYCTLATLEIRRVILRESARARLAGDWRALENASRACMALDPLNEGAVFGRAEAIALSGSKVAAVQYLDGYMKEAGITSSDLRLPAAILRRRISERLPDTSAARSELPFSGRADEMAALNESFTRARRGETQCVSISGEAGIGKTRLAREFSNLAILDGARVERVLAQSHDVHRPLGTFVELVPRLLELPGALGCSPESMTALKRLTNPDLRPRDDSTKVESDAESVFYSITSAITDLVDAITLESTLVLHLDDAHWLDSLSVRVIGDLVSDRRTRRLLIVITSRDATILRAGDRFADSIIRLPLRPINPEAASELVVSAVGAAAARDEQLISWMAHVSSGNPLFITVVASHFLATGERFSTPPSLTALLSKRLDSLDGRTLAILQVCAVMGKHTTIPRLADALEMSPLDLLQGLQEAQTSRVLGIHSGFISILHDLVRDIILERSAPLALSLAHRRTAEVLESASLSERSAADLWELAEHWFSAADSDRAIKAFRDCAQHALEIGRPREAGLALARALDVPVAESVHATVGRELVIAAASGAEYELARKGIYAWRSTEATIDHDAAEIAELRTKVMLFDTPDQTMPRLLGCVKNAAATVSHRVEAGSLALVVAQLEDRPERAQQAWNILKGLLQGRKDVDVVTRFLLIYHCAFGDLEEAALNARQLVDIAKQRSAAWAARANLDASRAFWAAGHTDNAISALEAGYSNSVRVGLRWSSFKAAASLASFLIDIDQTDTRAKPWMTRAEEISAESGEFRQSGEYITVRIQKALCDGNVEQASRYCATTQGVAIGTRIGQRWLQGLSLRARQLSGDSLLSDIALEPLVAAATRLPRQEISDTEIAIVVRALVARGQTPIAKQVFDDYINRSRLSRSPLDITLVTEANAISQSPELRRVRRTSAETAATSVTAKSLANNL